MSNLPFNSGSRNPDAATGSPQLIQTPQASKIPGKMFHLSLAALYERDNNPVPLVVTQCIQAVELFGLNVEGIYRQSGSMNDIHYLRALFDKGQLQIDPIILLNILCLRKGTAN
jgi:hypothetical protein